jgi:hypothetical protein
VKTSNARATETPTLQLFRSTSVEVSCRMRGTYPLPRSPLVIFSSSRTLVVAVAGVLVSGGDLGSHRKLPRGRRIRRAK